MFWNAGPRGKRPGSAILSSIFLTLPAKPERPGLPGDRTRSRQSVPERKPRQEPRTPGELRTALLSRGKVLLASWDVKSQARVPRPEAPSELGCAGRGRRVGAPITVSLSLHLAALRRPPSPPARGPGIICLRLGTPGPTAARINDPPATPDPNSKDTRRRTWKEAQAAMWRAGRKIIFIGLAFLLTELFPNDIYLTVFDSSYETSPVNRIYTRCAYNCLSAPKPIAVITAGSS